VRQGLVRSAALACALALAACASAHAAPYTPDRLIVAFRPQAGAPARTAARAAVSARILSGELGSPRTQLLAVRGPVHDALARLARDPTVAYAEPDYSFAYERQVNDPLFHIAWDLLNTGQGGGHAGDDADVTRAWDTTLGAGVLVGVVDSGVDLAHPDLRGAAAADPGWNVFDRDGDLSDHVGHGTHVAGTIVARANNHLGIAGIAPDASLVVAKVANGSGEPDAASLALALAYVGDRGARVVNMSIGGSARSLAVAAAIASHPNTLYVIAAGNDGRDNDSRRSAGDWPCDEPAANLICVAASDRYDGLPYWSNYGMRSVDLAAPGDAITSTVPGAFSSSGYATASGTSMAAPHVAGAAALLFAAAPGATVAQVKLALLAGAAHRPAFRGKTVSGGRLDVLRSLRILLHGRVAARSAIARSRAGA
jgi:thermitase